jgi:hypothetical protein
MRDEVTLCLRKYVEKTPSLAVCIFCLSVWFKSSNGKAFCRMLTVYSVYFLLGTCL